MNHKWIQNQAWGVTPGSGRPHGVDESWTCGRCGCSKGRGPQNTPNGARVVRWWYQDSESNRLASLPRCSSG